LMAKVDMRRVCPPRAQVGKTGTTMCQADGPTRTSRRGSTACKAWTTRRKDATSRVMASSVRARWRKQDSAGGRDVVIEKSRPTPNAVVHVGKICGVDGQRAKLKPRQTAPKPKSADSPSGCATRTPFRFAGRAKTGNKALQSRLRDRHRYRTGPRKAPRGKDNDQGRHRGGSLPNGNKAIKPVEYWIGGLREDRRLRARAKLTS